MARTRYWKRLMAKARVRKVFMRRRDGARISVSIGSAENEQRYTHTKTGTATRTDHGEPTMASGPAPEGWAGPSKEWAAASVSWALGLHRAARTARTTTSVDTAVTLKRPTWRRLLSVGRNVSGITSATAALPRPTASQWERTRPEARWASGCSSWRSRIWLATSVRNVVNTTLNTVSACAHRPAATQRTSSYVRRPPRRRAAESKNCTEAAEKNAAITSRPRPSANPALSTAQGTLRDPPPTTVPTRERTACQTSPRRLDA